MASEVSALPPPASTSTTATDVGDPSAGVAAAVIAGFEQNSPQVSTTDQQILDQHIQQHFQQLEQVQLQTDQFAAESDPTHGTLSQTLSAISAFNASYDTNQWNKRPVDEVTCEGRSSPDAKRQHLDSQHSQEQTVHGHVLQSLAEYQHPQQHEPANMGQAVVPTQSHETQQHHMLMPDQNAAHTVNHELSERIASEEADYEEDDEADESPFQTSRLNPFRPPQHDWSIPTNLMDDSTAVLWSANHALRVHSLPVVDNLSTQILLTLGKGPYQETLNIVTQPESDAGQAYGLLKKIFDNTKQMYTSEAFLSAEELKLDTPEQRAIIRKVNLATFVSSVFGSQEVGFFHLNECFLDTFVPDGGRLLKSQGALYLDLKTQAYISAIQQAERPKIDILSDLFPDDMAHQLLMRRPGAKGLTPSEVDFVQRAHQRKQHLMQLPEDPTLLSNKYVWQDFLQDVSSYVAKHFEQIMAQPVRKSRKRQSSQQAGHRSSSTSSYPRTDHPTQQYAVMQHQPAHVPVQTQVIEHQPQQVFPQQAEYQLQQPPTTDDADAATAAALSAHNAAHTAAQEQLQHQDITTNHTEQHLLNGQVQSGNLSQGADMNPQMYDPNDQSSPPPLQIHNHAGAPVANMTVNLGHPPMAPQIPAQTTPTQVLYERARLAAQSKASPNARRSGLPSQRRPWTPEEETALMAGLDRVKGPHWSQILAMFGPGGTINEVLKDRNQVQLKDKARNLKLFFLKSGIEVPYYLQFVTGELKTRAPSQAAKQQKIKQQMVAEGSVGPQSQYELNGGQSSDDDGVNDPANLEARAQARAHAQAQIDAVNAFSGELNRQEMAQAQAFNSAQVQTFHSAQTAQQFNNTQVQQFNNAPVQSFNNPSDHGQSQMMVSHEQQEYQPQQVHHHEGNHGLGEQESHQTVDLNGLMLDTNSVVMLSQALMMQQQQEEQQRKEEQNAHIQEQIEQLERLEQQQQKAELDAQLMQAHERQQHQEPQQHVQDVV